MTSPGLSEMPMSGMWARSMMGCSAWSNKVNPPTKAKSLLACAAVVVRHLAALEGAVLGVEVDLPDRSRRPWS